MTEKIEKKFDWLPLIFLTVTPILAAFLIPVYFYYFETNWAVIGFSILMWYATSMSITAGYHRLFAHRSYSAKKWFQFLTLFFGAATFQNSAFKWCSDHRKHHKNVDSDYDPYSAKKGMFHSHFGWMIFKGHTIDSDVNVDDLKANKLVMHQYKYYFFWAIIAGAVLPICFGWAVGDPMGGFVLAFLARMVGVHHITFFVNSLAHFIGRQTYSDEHTAKDSFIVAILTNGEGYHNFHHTFEADYRNGIRWYQWDPTKWLIKFMSWLGQTSNLKKVPDHRIFLARMNMQKQLLMRKGVNTEKLDALREKLDEVQKTMNKLRREYIAKKQELVARKCELALQGREKVDQLKLEWKISKIEYQKTVQQLRVTLAELNRIQPAMA